MKELTDEPVAWVPRWAIHRLTGKLGPEVTWGVDAPLYAKEVEDAFPIYTTPPAQPAREWVGLTDEQISDLYYSSGYNSAEYDCGALEFARSVESKLRGKNTT